MGEGSKKEKIKSKFKKKLQKKIHVDIQYPDQIFQEEKMYIIASYNYGYIFLGVSGFSTTLYRFITHYNYLNKNIV